MRKIAGNVHFMIRQGTRDDCWKIFVWRYALLWLSGVTRSGESELPPNTKSLETILRSDLRRGTNDAEESWANAKVESAPVCYHGYGRLYNVAHLERLERIVRDR